LFACFLEKPGGDIMPTNSENLHGGTHEQSPVVLLLIDVINDMEFIGGDKLLKNALPIAEKIAALKRRAKQSNIPVIYVNDNFGKWQSDFKKLLTHCLEDKVCGQPLAQILRPDEDDYFVLKPKHSGFFSTSLQVLLQYVGAQTLILTGLTGDSCILFTANDAYMRDYHLFIPADCVASEDEETNRQMLEHMSRVLKADIRPSEELDLEKIKAKE
jgi:nicotinamidase-related amidase